MRNKRAKQIKKIINLQDGDKNGKRLYRRLKRQFSSLNDEKKNIFIKNLKEKFEND